MKNKKQLLKPEIFFKENINILERMISDITKIDYTLLKDNINIKAKDLNNNSKEKANFLVEFDNEDNIIIEINKDSYARLLIKNIICILMGIENKEKDESKNIKLIQIHLNYEENCKKEISKYRIKEYIDEESSQSILCIELSPPLCEKLYQTKKEVENAIKWGALLNCNNTSKSKEILTTLLPK